MEVPNTFFDLFLGYTAVWAILAVFIVRMTRAQAKTHRELEALQRQITVTTQGTAEAAVVNQ